MRQPADKEGSMSHESRQEVAKKTYVSPSLLEYGSISKLTQGTSGTKADGATFRSVCL